VWPYELERWVLARPDAYGPLPTPSCSMSSCCGLRSHRRDRLVRGNPATRTFAELLIDCEEVHTLRAVHVGMLREDEPS